MQHSPGNRFNSLRNSLTQPLQNSLHRKDRVDAFKINLPTVSKFRASLHGIAKGANVDLELVNRNGAVVASSHKRGRKPEKLEIEKLEAGNYRLRAILKQGERTRYKLNFKSTPRPGIVLDEGPIINPGPNPQPGGGIRPDQGGNSLASATNRGKIGATASRISDALDSNDVADWYSFTIGEDGLPSNRVNLSLTSDAGVFAHVYHSAAPHASLGSVTSYSGNNLFGNSKLALASGTYLLKVAPVGGNPVNYNLDLSATGIGDQAGNTKATARPVNNLQPLNTSGQPVAFTDFVGHGDSFDNYIFRTDTKSTLTIQFDRLSNNNPTKTRIQHQLSKLDGLPPASLYWKNAQGASLSGGIDALTSPSYTLTGELEPGTYNLELKSYFSDGDNEYRVTFSTTP